MARIIVCGYMIRHPMAGMQMAFFHYVLGLHRLGHEVLYLEESGWPKSCYNPVTQQHGDDPTYGLRTVRGLLDRYKVPVEVAYVQRDTGHVHGMEHSDLMHRLDTADLLMNVGGVCSLPEFHRCKRRVLVDMDPLFTQIGQFGAADVGNYHRYFTYGANIGHGDCPIPTRGVEWHPTVPPVVPDLWQPGPRPRTGDTSSESPPPAYSTIANWTAYGGISYEGEHYGQKGEEFLRLVDLPSHVSARLELALANASSEIQAQLNAAGWSLSDGASVSRDLPTYRRFIDRSRGEFSVAKNAYVKSRSGWFSDRSICYLAAGRPVILQDTGFSDWLPTGRGVLSFSSLEEAVHCIDEVESSYAVHSRAAREIAEHIFSYDVALPRLIDTALEESTERRRQDDSIRSL